MLCPYSKKLNITQYKERGKILNVLQSKLLNFVKCTFCNMDLTVHF